LTPVIKLNKNTTSTQYRARVCKSLYDIKGRNQFVFRIIVPLTTAADKTGECV